MLNKDSLQRFIFDKAPVRGEFIHLDESYRTIINQHAYPPPIRRLLGEALCVATLLTAIIKFNGRLTVQFRGKGKLKLLLAQCDNRLQLRGLVKWEGDLSYEDLMESFNDGVLAIMLDSGSKKKSSYQGFVKWRGNSLVESIEAYFRESEQLATKLWLAIDDECAAGMLLQVLPTKDSQLQSIEHETMALHWERITRVTALITSHDLLYSTSTDMLRRLYPEEDIRLFESTPVSFRCTCSRARGEEAIAILGQKEAEDELRIHQVIVVTCDFCNSEYTYDRVDVAAIFAKKNGGATDNHLH